MTDDFELFRIGRAARLWYESTERNGQFGEGGKAQSYYWTGRILPRS